MVRNDISVIYEDENMLVINKPAGLIVHPDGRNNEFTLSDWVFETHPETIDVGEPIKLTNGKEIKKYGIVHRIDRDTTGVLIIAKNQETFLFLKKQFQNREVNKIYRAITYGRIKEKNGIIDAPIGKSRNDFRQWSAEKDARGKLREATTEYQVITTTPDYSYISLHPKTGRTHQIRVHLKSIGHPVLCDKLYASNRNCLSTMGRMALHAFSIAVTSQDGVKLVIEAPLPKDFESTLAELHLS